MKDIKEGSFLDFCKTIKDHRINRRKLYSVSELLLLTFVAILCGCEGWEDIEAFGKARINFLRQFLLYANGTPSDDTLRRFFRCLNPEHFQECFTKWVKTLQTLKEKTISIDGKVSRHTFDDTSNPLYLVHAFASETRLVLGQQKVSDKSNEITAIPELLALLDLEGATITIDAMGCQRTIAQQIVDAKADYLLALKGNQGTLHEDIKLLFHDKEALESLSKDNIFTDVDAAHGRIETRTCKIMPLPEELIKEHDWPGLVSGVEIESIRELKNKTEAEKRYFIASFERTAEQTLRTSRSHWAVENSLHYVLDVTFKDDDSRIRKGNAPLNLAILKHAALNQLRLKQEKRESIKLLRKKISWDLQRLLQVLF